MLSAEAVDRWAADWGDDLNPILVKETRQVFKTKLVTVPFIFALLAAWFIAFAYVLQPAHPEAVRGPELFRYLIMLLSLALFYVVPYVAFRSMAAERDYHTMEMLYVSALSNGQIFWGKLASAVLLIGLFEAAFAPFISMTYLLRGLSVVLIGFALIGVTAGAVTLTIFALMLGAAARQVHWQIVNMLILLGGATIGLTVVSNTIFFTDSGIEGACCLVAFTIFPSTFFGAAALSSLRPPTFGMVRTYVGPNDLPAIIVAARDLAIAIHHDVPLKADPAKPGRKTVTPHTRRVSLPRESSMRLLHAVVGMERVLNPRRRDFSHLGRYRYLTIKGAAKPLEQICSAQNVILHRFGWSESCLKDENEILIEDETTVFPLPETTLQKLQEAVEQLKRVLDRRKEATTEECEIRYLPSEVTSPMIH